MENQNRDLATPSEAPPLEPKEQPTDQEKTIQYLQGVRFWTVSILIAITLFLVQIEASIVTSALVAISNDIGGFDNVSWIISGYLLGYVAAAMILTKFSDIFGRKTIIVPTLAAFTIFSGGCAAAKTMTQLIILRSFQGTAGGASQALATILILEIVPPHKYGKQSANTGLAIVLAMVTGPIIGGAICSHTTWRWIFLFNVPVGSLAVAMAILGIPQGFPYHGQQVSKSMSKNSQWAKVDFIGCTLLFLATLSFTAAFQEAGARFAWNSAYVIVLLIVSVILWLILLFWERSVTLQDGICEPVLPWRFFTNRAMTGILLGMFIVGGPLTVTSFQVPQRFQLINNLSPLDAAVRLVPFGAGVPVGTIFGATIAGGKLRVPFIYMVVAASLLQIIGFALLGTLPIDSQVPSAAYGYLVIAGLGCGMSFQMFMLAIPFTAEKRDQAQGLGTANQLRAMGSSVGVAIATAIFNGQFPTVSGNITDKQNQSPDVRHDEMVSNFSRGYNNQMLFLCACAATQMMCGLLLWRRNKEQIRSVGH